jgi:hypothetical protein
MTKTSREQFWQNALFELSETVEELKGRNAPELFRLVDSPVSKEIRRDSFAATIMAWARVHEGGKLGVLVEVRQKRLGGIIDSVAADGFFRGEDGSTEAMTEENLWDYGY